jgi:phage terminase Nu1 subunit (DNA packaging protein)
MQVDRFGLAEIFDVSPDTVRDWARQGCPVAREPKTGKGTTAEERKRLFTPADVHRWLLNRELRRNRW